MASKIFDVHQHFGSLEFSVDKKSSGEQENEIEKDYKRRVNIMEKYGISQGCIMPSLQYDRPNGQKDTENINDRISRYKKEKGVKFPLALGTVEPLHGADVGVKEIERIKDELDLDGVVWHHRFQGTHVADSRMKNFLKRMEELSMPAVIHIFSESNLEAPIELENLAMSFPDMNFLALDSLSSPTNANYMISICKRLDNIYIDTACLFAVGRLVDKFVDEVGVDRVIFGTDLYLNPDLYNYPMALGEIENSETLSNADREKIFSKNVWKLFKGYNK